MTLAQAQEGKEYIIQRIETDDEDLDAFLFSLGCYSGEPITVVSRRRNNLTVSIKDGRYNIDSQLAEAIILWFQVRKNDCFSFANQLASANYISYFSANAVK